MVMMTIRIFAFHMLLLLLPGSIWNVRALLLLMSPPEPATSASVAAVIVREVSRSSSRLSVSAVSRSVTT